jgi:hypothetical protein
MQNAVAVALEGVAVGVFGLRPGAAGGRAVVVRD